MLILPIDRTSYISHHHTSRIELCGSYSITIHAEPKGGHTWLPPTMSYNIPRLHQVMVSCYMLIVLCRFMHTMMLIGVLVSLLDGLLQDIWLPLMGSYAGFRPKVKKIPESCFLDPKASTWFLPITKKCIMPESNWEIL